jgi:hypothetical protein
LTKWRSGGPSLVLTVLSFEPTCVKPSTPNREDERLKPKKAIASAPAAVEEITGLERRKRRQQRRFVIPAWGYEFQYSRRAVSGSLRRRIVLSMELAVVLFRFEHPCEIRSLQAVSFDLNLYALQVLSDIRPGYDILPDAGGDVSWTKYDAYQP